jgi:hypothetical protein
MTTEVDIKDVGDTNVNDAEEALVPFLELALVENLHCDDGRVLDGAAVMSVSSLACMGEVIM